jgi:hypothetical protein
MDNADNVEGMDNMQALYHSFMGKQKKVKVRRGSHPQKKMDY